MASQIRSQLVLRRADISMVIIITIWGLNFVVLKDVFGRFDPLTFNTLRFLLGAPFMLLAAAPAWTFLRVSRHDFFALLRLSLLGPVAYQVFFPFALNMTTATNSALLTATMPTWTALLSVMVGMIAFRRLFLVGLGVTLAGVALVILSKEGGGLSLSENDMVGGGLLLFGAFISAIFAVYSKTYIDRYGGVTVGILSYWFTSATLGIITLPQLVKLSPADFPPNIFPSLFYSSILASVGGYLVFNSAVRTLGPSRAATYHNFTPLIAAVAGIVLLDEPLSVLLVMGGILTLMGVTLVRTNTYEATTADLSFPLIAQPSAAED